MHKMESIRATRIDAHTYHTYGKFENDDGGNYEENACISHENLRSSSVISHIVAGESALSIIHRENCST